MRCRGCTLSSEPDEPAPGRGEDADLAASFAHFLPPLALPGTLDLAFGSLSHVNIDDVYFAMVDQVFAVAPTHTQDLGQDRP